VERNRAGEAWYSTVNQITKGGPQPRAGIPKEEREERNLRVPEGKVKKEEGACQEKGRGKQYLPQNTEEKKKKKKNPCRSTEFYKDGCLADDEGEGGGEEEEGKEGMMSDDFLKAESEPIPSRVGENATAFFFFDLKTTERSQYRDQIIQIAVVDEKGESFSAFVNSNRRMEEGGLILHQSKMKQIKQAPFLEDVGPQFVPWIDRVSQGKKVVLIAHKGSSFDFPLLHFDLKRRSKMLNLLSERNFLFLDTLAMFQKLRREQCLPVKSPSQS